MLDSSSYGRCAGGEWLYDYGTTKYDGKVYHTIQEFLTMYPYYEGSQAKHDEMIVYYDIPITITLKGVWIEFVCVDQDGNVLRDAGKMKVLVGEDLTYNNVSPTLTVSGKEYKYQKYMFEDITGTERDITLHNITKDGKLYFVYSKKDEPAPTPPPHGGNTGGANSGVAIGLVAHWCLYTVRL